MDTGGLASAWLCTGAQSHCPSEPRPPHVRVKGLENDHGGAVQLWGLRTLGNLKKK